MKRNHTLPARLTRMNLIVSGAVLLMAALAFFSYDLISFRRDLIRSLESEAQIVGENSVSALLFNDQVSAANTLRGLHNAPDVLSATLIADDGTVFAHYGAEKQDQRRSHKLAPEETDRVWISATDVLLAHRIMFQNKAVGTVFITARLREIGERARRYLFIAGIIWLFCMAAAVLISSFSRRLIAKPITALADTAMRVSRDRDYSVRADVMADSNEIAVLIDAFNIMLKQIQERDAAINQARNQLETRVEERTAALRAANRELEAFSQLGTELDKATQKQLDRGARLVELLKQPQFRPMPIEQEVMVVYAGTQGHLDIPLPRVQEFQTAFLAYVDASVADLREDLKAKGELTADLEAKLKQALGDFKSKAWKK